MKKEFNSGFLTFGLITLIFYIWGNLVGGELGELFLFFGMFTFFMCCLTLSTQIIIWTIPDKNKSLGG